MTVRSVYCMDTSAFIEAWSRSYPPDNFPALWKNIEALIADGRLRSPDKVKGELAAKEDNLYQWAKSQGGLFVPIDYEQAVRISQILAEFRILVENAKGRHGADPWVIVLAELRGYTVVTQEKFGTKDKPRIPYVCTQRGVKHITLLDLIQIESWTF